MIEQNSNNITFLAQYISSKTGKTGLSPTVNLYQVTGINTVTTIASGVSAFSIGDGLYGYTLAASSVSVEGLYLSVFKTTDTTVDQQHIPALWVINKAGVEHLDVDTSTRLASASYTAPDNTTISNTYTSVLGLETSIVDIDNLVNSIDSTVGNIDLTVTTIASNVSSIKNITDILNTLLEYSSGYRFTAKALEEAPIGGGSASDVWNYLTASITSSGSIGEFLLERLDRSISSLTARPATTSTCSSKPCNEFILKEGEAKPIFAGAKVDTGTLTITGTPIVELYDNMNTLVYGVSGNVTGYDNLPDSNVKAYYLLDTLNPPQDGPIAKGSYTMKFTMNLYSSEDEVTSRRVFEVVIVVD